MYMGSKQIAKPYLGVGLLNAVYLGETMVWGGVDDAYTVVFKLDRSGTHDGGINCAPNTPIGVPNFTRIFPIMYHFSFKTNSGEILTFHNNDGIYSTNVTPGPLDDSSIVVSQSIWSEVKNRQFRIYWHSIIYEGWANNDESTQKYRIPGLNTEALNGSSNFNDWYSYETYINNTVNVNPCSNAINFMGNVYSDGGRSFSVTYNDQSRIATITVSMDSEWTLEAQSYETA